MPADPPNTPEPDDPPLTEAEAALLRRAATMPMDELDRLIRHVDQVREQTPHAGDNKMLVFVVAMVASPLVGCGVPRSEVAVCNIMEPSRPDR